MTEQIYNSDAYIKELESKIIEVNMDHIVLDKTIFFPGGGGQPNDLGSIYLKDKEFKLEKISWKDGKIAHFLNDNNLNVGDLIVCKLDWSRRFKLMRTHTAMHILCGVIWRDYQAAVTGGNMEPLKGRMDFEFPSLSAELTEEIEQKLNIEVQKNRKITVDFLPREEAFKIPDLIRTKVNLLVG